MSSTTKNKVLIAAVAILLVTNIAVLVYFLSCNKPPQRSDPRKDREQAMVDFLKKDIGFSDQQMSLYDTLSKEHKTKVRADFDSMRKSKQVLFKELGPGGFGDSVMNSVARRSADLQEQMEIQMLQHFKKIRALCTADQVPKFDSLFYKIWNKKPEKNKK